MRIERFDIIDSTNKYLREKKDIQEKDVAIAVAQSEGRGRRGNRWTSEEGAALFSFALKYTSEIKEEDYSKLSLVVGYSLLKSLKEIENLDYKFKWTNDLYLRDKKLSGILIEKVNDFYIIGIGININNCNLENIENIATSLKKETAKNYNIEKIILKVIDDFFINFEKFKNGNWKEILFEINCVNYLFGKRIDIVGLNEEVSGIAGDIMADGMLEVFIGKEIRRYNVGEIHISKSN